jgi:hypothetical protein
VLDAFIKLFNVSRIISFISEPSSGCITITLSALYAYLSVTFSLVSMAPFAYFTVIKMLLMTLSIVWGEINFAIIDVFPRCVHLNPNSIQTQNLETLSLLHLKSLIPAITL